MGLCGMARDGGNDSRPRRLWRALERVPALAAAVIAIAVLAAWSNSLNGPFIFDDVQVVQKNPTIRRLPSLAVWMPPGSCTVARRPAANASFALDYAIGDLNVRMFHVTNLLIHLLAALTLFGILRRTFLLPSLRARFGPAATRLATAVAVLWAVHPLQTESVTYIVQRVESLMGLFYLLTLYCAIRGATDARPARWYALAVAACALGMGTKEVMVTAPIVVLLYDRALLSGSFREAIRRRRALYLGLAATWALLGAILAAYPGRPAAGFGLGTVTAWEYARTQPSVILHYLKLAFWPHPLCLDYSWPVATAVHQILPAAVAVAALAAGALWAFRRRPPAGFLGLWFFLILAPTSSFMPIQDMAFEHRMYLPLAAVVSAAVVAAYLAGERLASRVARKAEWQKRLGWIAAAVLALAAVGFLGRLTFRRNADYRTAISIWEDTTRKQPGNPRAWANLGDACCSEGLYNQAIQDCNTAITVNPNFAMAYYNRASAFMHVGRRDLALPDYNKAIELQPHFAMAYYDRGNLFLAAASVTDAIEDFNKAILLNPHSAEAFNDRANACVRNGRYDLALLDYSSAIELNPKFALAYYNRGNAYTDMNRVPEAIEDFSKAIGLKPADAESYYNRAVLYYRIKEYGLATADVKRFQQLGGRPNPEFLKSLRQSAGRPE